MGEIQYYNYPSFPLAQKYGWFRAGPGAEGAMQAGDSLTRIAARLDISDATIGAGLIERRLGSSWEGGAAQAASGAFDHAAAVLASLSSSSSSGGGTAQRFGDSFNATKNSVPAPRTRNWLSNAIGDTAAVAVAGTVAGPAGGFWAAQTDGRATDVANRQADLAANEALKRHEDTTREVLAGYQSAATGASTTATVQGGTQPSARTAGASAASEDPAGGSGGGTASGSGGGTAPGTGGGTVPGTGGGTAPGAGQPKPAGGAEAGHAGAAGGPGHAGMAGGGRSAGAAGGTTSAGAGPGATTAAGAGSHGGTATGTGGAGWALSQPRNGPGSGGIGSSGIGSAGIGSAGMTPRSGGDVAAGHVYLPDAVPTDQPLPPRTDERAPAARISSGAGPGGPTVAGANARGAGPGMAPMGVGGVGAGGGEREHRNQFYIPEDEPFRVEYDFYVAPPVLGTGEAQGDLRESP